MTVTIKPQTNVTMAAGVSSRAGPRDARLRRLRRQPPVDVHRQRRGQQPRGALPDGLPRRERLKILGHARVHDAHERPDLAQQVHPLGSAAAPERIFVVNVLSFDWNCPKFITPRYTLEEVEVATAPLHRRIAELEAQLAAAPTRE